MKIDLLYGRNGITIDLADEIKATVIRKHPMTPLSDPHRSVSEALEHPVDCVPLSQLARGKKDACILICDITRPVPNSLLLPPLLETVLAAGIARENILILVATGLHRPNEGEELREIIGDDTIFDSFAIENHYARDREAHADLGHTTGGIPIRIDRRFVEADLKIVTGLVEPHFMAGYSGGRKVVAPGVAHQDTILMFHTARIIEHPNAANCVIESNPLHNEQIEIVRKIGGIVAVNVVIDEQRCVGFVNFGDIEASHMKAVTFMRRYAEVSIPRRFNTVITTAAGYPLDKTYYQTVKGMVGPMDILEPGGTLIIASACSEGMGSREFVASQQRLCAAGPEKFMALLKSREKAEIDEWESEMLLKPLRLGRVQLYTTGLGEADLRDTFVEPVSSVEAAAAASVKAHKDANVVVIPEGPYMIPLFGGADA